MFQNSRHHTQKYSKRSDNGKRVSKKEMTFKNGIPTVTGSEPRMDYWLSPNEQKETVDPMTAIMALLADQPKGASCQLAMGIYDGARRFAIKLTETIISNGKLNCKGIYTKIGGYSEKQWAQGKGFPFELRCVLQDNIYWVDHLVMSTSRGRTSFIRR
jgi:hypothetical protein